MEKTKLQDNENIVMKMIYAIFETEGVYSVVYTYGL
jgi:hypothetical protein